MVWTCFYWTIDTSKTYYHDLWDAFGLKMNSSNSKLIYASIELDGITMISEPSSIGISSSYSLLKVCIPSTPWAASNFQSKGKIQPRLWELLPPIHSRLEDLKHRTTIWKRRAPSLFSICMVTLWNRLRTKIGACFAGKIASWSSASSKISMSSGLKWKLKINPRRKNSRNRKQRLKG